MFKKFRIIYTPPLARIANSEFFYVLHLVSLHLLLMSAPISKKFHHLILELQKHWPQ